MVTTSKVQEMAAPVAFTLSVSHPLGQAQMAVLHVNGVLNYRTYEAFIDRATALYTQGTRRLIIDLRRTPQIELSGLFALHSIARLYGSKSLLNPTVGWMALQAAAQHITPAMQERVKLLAPLPTVAQAIQKASFCRFLETYNDLATAVAAFDGVFVYPCLSSFIKEENHV